MSQRQENVGLIDLASNLQAAGYLSSLVPGMQKKKRRKNPPNDNTVALLEKRLADAIKVLKVHEQTYGNKTEFYQDQLNYIAALRETLEARSSEWAKKRARNSARKNPQWTIARVKDELPDVPVKFDKQIKIGVIRGRKNRFATVRVDELNFKFAWETIANALNEKRPLLVLLPDRNPAPTEYDNMDDEGNWIDEGVALGAQQARALGRSAKEHRSRVKFYNVTWYSARRGKRTGFVQPIEAANSNDARQQARAMITNEKPVNIVAKEVKRNPRRDALADLERYALSRGFEVWPTYTSSGGWTDRVRIAPIGKREDWSDYTSGSDSLTKAEARRVIAKEVKQNPREKTFIVSGYTKTGQYHALTIAASSKARALAMARAQNRMVTDKAERVVKWTAKEVKGNPSSLMNKRLESFVVVENPKNSGKVRIVYNRLLGGWYVVVGPHQTPLNGRFDSKAEAQAWLARKNPAGDYQESDKPYFKQHGNRHKQMLAQGYIFVKSVKYPSQSEPSTNVYTKDGATVHLDNKGKITLNYPVTHQIPKLNPDLRARLVAAATAYDRQESKKKSYNHNALPQYFMRIDEVVADVNRGADVRKAIAAGFSGRLLDRMLKAAGHAKSTDSEQRGGMYYQPTKKNPSAREMSETFQGAASGQVRELKASDRAPSNLSRAGKLVFLKLAKQKGQLRIPGAVVCIDPKTQRLWIVGNRAPLFNQKAKYGEVLDFDEVDRICYETAKRHIGNGKRTEYVHTFGEDGGRRPRLHIDSDGMPILAGGDYKIRAEGIVN